MNLYMTMHTMLDGLQLRQSFDHLLLILDGIAISKRLPVIVELLSELLKYCQEDFVQMDWVSLQMLAEQLLPYQGPKGKVLPEQEAAGLPRL